MTAKTDLFEPSAQDWQKKPLASFDTWLAQQDFASSSAAVYRAQWQQFVSWVALHKMDLRKVAQHDIETFLLGRDIRQNQRQRYLRLIERVLAHLYRGSMGTRNPASAAAVDPQEDWAAVAPNEPTGFIGREESLALARALSAPLPPALSTIGKWRELRDRTMVALFLGAGLKMSELQDLTVSCVFCKEGWLLIDDAASRFSHRTRMQPFARELVSTWLAERAAANTEGSLVFPATRAGRPLHKATVLRATTDQLARIGLPARKSERASPQTLRNSYAASLFEAGHQAELVAQWLGFSQVLSAQRIKGAWDVWLQRHAPPYAG